MQTFNIKAETEDSTQIEAIKAVLKALKIKFSITKSAVKPYKAEFLKKIKQSEEDIKKGNYTTLKANDIDKYIDLL